MKLRSLVALHSSSSWQVWPPRSSAVPGGFGGFRRYPPRFPNADTFGHGFNFCRGIYTQHPRAKPAARAGPPTIPTPS